MERFSDIAFGYVSAEAERTEDPGLLLDGYVDLREASEEALNRKTFLFLGHKGAGKSAIAERMELKLSDSFGGFVKLVSLADFPFIPFDRIVRGNEEPEAKYPTAWSWILLVYLLESFAQDQSICHPDRAAFEDATKAFRAMGLSPAADPGTIVRASVKKTFKLALPGKLAEFAWSGSDTRPASEIPDFVGSLKGLIAGIRGENRHFLVIDGLDDILTTREIQYKSLAALIYEVSRLNLMFEQNNVPAKINLLCRTDLFELVPGPNKNKIRQDHGLELDWYRDPREPESSELVRIAHTRAKRTLRRDVAVFQEFLPTRVDDKKVEVALLEMTRHTPRDFLRLLHHIQQFPSNTRRVSVSAVKSGMRDYSIRYFLPEIQDELSGYATPSEISGVIDALGRLRKRDFRLSELVESSKTTITPLSDERIHEIVRALFRCSALGNIQRRWGKYGATTHYTFKYRNRHSSFNDGEDIMLHRGLWKALNLI